MPHNHPSLAKIKDFPALVGYLRDELEWPIEEESFDDLIFDYEPEELGIDSKLAVKIREIKQLRPLSSKQPWGIFFIAFEPKRLPVVAMRRILQQLTIKKRTSAAKSEQAAWALHDLLFISSYGEAGSRTISLAHFSDAEEDADLPTLRVLGWDDQDTGLHIEHVHKTLEDKMRWPDDEADAASWREAWSSAFTLRNRQVINTSKDLAIRLADLAISIRKRANAVLAVESEKGKLRILHKAFKEALIHDLNEDDFADMYAQTIAYGLLSARVSRPAGLIADNITDMIPISSPFLKELLETFLNVGGRNRKSKIDFDELGISEVVEALRDTDMEAVLRDFGDKNPQEDPVIHFYELFLKEYDPKKRMQRGVFYTPRPVVSFIVRSVHEILQKEFGLEDGLADTTTWGEVTKRNKEIIIPKDVSPDAPFVQILDPATGTATFLVEVIGLIAEHMKTKWRKQGKREAEVAELWNDYVPRHLLPRLYGFELMMAPYAIAHMKIGLKLGETGYLFGNPARVQVYLTNTLEEPHGVSQLNLLVPLLAHEAHAANVAKKDVPITVVLGNPPYAYESTNNEEWISSLIQDYYRVDNKPLGERNPRGLQDDYVKFIRYGQFRITSSGVGTLAYITNHGYLDNPTFRGMRQNILNTFQHIRVIDLHGNSKKKERAPGGGKDENVFEIQQGVAICSFVKLSSANDNIVQHADLYGERTFKYSNLVQTASLANLVMQELFPQSQYYLLAPQNINLKSEYSHLIPVDSIFTVHSSGMNSLRDALVIGYRKNELEEVIFDFTDRSLSDSFLQDKYKLKESRDWKLTDCRKGAIQIGKDTLVKSITSCLYRPFDKRYIIFEDCFVGYPRHETSQHFLCENSLGFATTRQTQADFSCLSSRIPFGQHKIVDPYDRSYVFPVFIYADKLKQTSLNYSYSWPPGKDGRIPNLSLEIVKKTESSLGLRFVPEADNSKACEQGAFAPEDLFYYVYAILYSPEYRKRYAEFLKIDFPRIPISSSVDLFRSLGKLGAELTALHLLESSSLHKPITTFHEKGDRQIVKVGEKGKTLAQEQNGKGRVYINSTSYFDNVPQTVWEFHIGGYQVCHKWLDDRRKAGRSLSDDDIAHYQKIIVAINETIRIMAEIDQVIDEHGGWPIA